MADGPADDLDALIRRVDPDRWLSSRFIGDREKRADVIALYAFDYELRRAAEATTSPLMAEIRLTWWSEALDEIYAGGPVRRPKSFGAADRRHRYTRTRRTGRPRQWRLLRPSTKKVPRSREHHCGAMAAPPLHPRGRGQPHAP